jgi:hypothetical protein
MKKEMQLAMVIKSQELINANRMNITINKLNIFEHNIFNLIKL